MADIKPHLAEDEKDYTFADLTPINKKNTVKWFLIVLISALAYLILACGYLHADKIAQDTSWNSKTSPNNESLRYAEDIASIYGATHVQTGIYVENVKSVSIKDSQYVADMTVWFRWTGDDDLDMANHFRVYKGTVTNKDVAIDTVQMGEHYQQVRFTATITRDFHTTRFPLESLQLHTYIESEYTADRVIFDADLDSSAINPSIYASGYDISRTATTATAYRYTTDLGETFKDGGNPVTSELFNNIEVKRSGFGLYLLCFIAMYGTSLWVLISLFLAARRRVDPLGMIPSALFGTVSNVMVGAVMLPSSLDVGLLVFVNIWGIATILVCTGVIIHVNSLRSNLGGGVKNQPPPISEVCCSS